MSPHPLTQSLQSSTLRPPSTPSSLILLQPPENPSHYASIGGLTLSLCKKELLKRQIRLRSSSGSGGGSGGAGLISICVGAPPSAPPVAIQRSTLTAKALADLSLNYNDENDDENDDDDDNESVTSHFTTTTQTATTRNKLDESISDLTTDLDLYSDPLNWDNTGAPQTPLEFIQKVYKVAKIKAVKHLNSLNSKSKETDADAPVVVSIALTIDSYSAFLDSPFCSSPDKSNTNQHSRHLTALRILKKLALSPLTSPSIHSTFEHGAGNCKVCIHMNPIIILSHPSPLNTLEHRQLEDICDTLIIILPRKPTTTTTTAAATTVKSKKQQVIEGPPTTGIFDMVRKSLSGKVTRSQGLFDIEFTSRGVLGKKIVLKDTSKGNDDIDDNLKVNELVTGKGGSAADGSESIVSSAVKGKAGISSTLLMASIPAPKSKGGGKLKKPMLGFSDDASETEVKGEEGGGPNIVFESDDVEFEDLDEDEPDDDLDL